MIFNYDKIPFWQDEKVLHKNRLKPRAFFIPYDKRENLKSNALPEDSPLIQMLDGEWLFRFYNSAMAIDETVFTTNDDFYSVNVPSCWQSHDAEKPVYINVAYQFPAVPPYVPYENPCGVYKRTFFIKEKKGRYTLSFLGVSSAFSVYINGAFIGYSEGSHCVSEFDVQPYLIEGENVICVLCFKWCNGSYLECQDMFRHNGIFRSVYITNTPNSCIYDYDLKTDCDKGEISLSVETLGEGNICVTIEDDSQVLISQNAVVSGDKHICLLQLEKPKLWSAEVPNLYNLVIEFIGKEEKEVVCQPFGFKKVEIKNGVFLLNEKPIKIKGVNHHDTHPDRLFALNIDDMERDVFLIKSLNMNAIRFSHYPPHPYMIELCDKYGLYVIDEADIETHGELFTDAKSGSFANDNTWREHFSDRTERLYQRDKNHTSVIMWSLGNESGYGENLAFCYDYLKSKISNSIIHYEGGRDYEKNTSDVLSFMYATPDELKASIKTSDKPVFLCEYLHCMGVGPGGVKEYIELFEKEEKMLGGCVWEWAEHAVRKNNRFIYGGESGEVIHDGNFCVDGMVSPDRQFTPSAYEIANAYRPLKAKLKHDKVFIFNYNYFKDLNVKVILSHIVDGIKVDEKIYELSIKAREEWCVPISFEKRGNKEEFLNLDYFENERLIGYEQLYFGGDINLPDYEYNGAINFTENEGKIIVNCDKKTVTFDKIINTISNISDYGCEFLNQSPQMNKNTDIGNFIKGFTYDLYRYGIDNDMYIAPLLKQKYLDHLWNNVISRKIEKYENRIEIKVFSILSPPKISQLFSSEIVYKIFGNGVIEINATVFPEQNDLTELYKFGLKFEMPCSFTKVEYYGYGERENYSDFLESARIGVYRQNVNELGYDYIKPQENGNRSGVRYLKVIDEKNSIALKLNAVSSPFNFIATNYDCADFECVKHNYDLKRKDSLNIHIAGAYAGIGSNSCGPLPFEKYKIKLDKPITFKFFIETEKI